MRMSIRLALLLVASGAAAAHADSGDLDTAFGLFGAGYATHAFDLGGNKADTSQAVLVQPGGGIVLVGRVIDSASSGRIALARFTADGLLDGSFGSSGSTTLALASGPYSAAYPYVNSAALDAQGRIVVVGDTADDDCSYAARFTANGAPDASFGIGGVFAICPSSGRYLRFMDVTIDTAGRPVIAGTYGVLNGDLVTESLYLAARLTTAGALDPSFNGGAMYTKSIGLTANSKDHAATVALDHAGRIYIGGGAETGSNRDDLVVVRLTAAGVADSSCSGRGWADIGGSVGEGFVATGMVFRDAHHLVLAGTSFDLSDSSKTGITHAEMDADTCSQVWISSVIPATVSTAGRAVAASDGTVYLSYSQRFSNQAGSAWYAGILALYAPLAWNDSFTGIYAGKSTYGTGMALVGGKPLQAMQAQYDGEDYDFAVARFQNDRIFYANQERDGVKASP
jgi:uncharacterized delta-60 repeat protein